MTDTPMTDPASLVDPAQDAAVGGLLELERVISEADSIRDLALIGLYLTEGRSSEANGLLCIEWALGDRAALLEDAEGWALEEAPDQYDRIFAEPRPKLRILKGSDQ